jgi:hypothetical protein
VTIENTSDETFLSTPLAPGVYVVHDDRADLFTTGQADRGEGLEALAEDGDPSGLAAHLGVAAGVRVSGTLPAIPPGASETFTVVAEGDARLSLANMLVASNDRFLAFDPAGLALFENGAPVEGDVTNALRLWDAGTEADELAGAGAFQPMHQPGPDTGPGEGVIRRAQHATRAVPPAQRLVAVRVTESGGAYTVELENASASAGFVTPLAPVFHAVHDASYATFTAGQPVLPNGLETLAEDGSPAGLVSWASAQPGVLAAGGQALTAERPTASPGPAAPGERFRFTARPDAAHPRLSLAAMLVETNDLFVGTAPEGVALLDGAGQPRSAADVEADLRASLALWDAGTEVNQTPGAGADQPIRQAGPNTGAADPDPTVRPYVDLAADLAEPFTSGFARVEVLALGAGRFEITVRNTSSGAFQGFLTPVAWAVHDFVTRQHEVGMPASPALEALAEDGDASGFAAAMAALPGTRAAGVQALAVGASAPGPIGPGESYQFTVEATTNMHHLSLATMVVPSNDTYLALDRVPLLDGAGQPRLPAAINGDLARVLGAFDAGTEANQIGAAGPDQAPRQAGPNTGAAEGDGTVRPVTPADTPAVTDMVRVTLRAR